MAGFFASGHVIDAILVLVACEAVFLTVWGRRRVALRPLLFNLGSGAALMLAVRGALTGAAWWTVAACLFAACVAHATELGLRLRHDIGPCLRRMPPERVMPAANQSYRTPELGPKALRSRTMS
jgi:hypothetical protein